MKENKEGSTYLIRDFENSVTEITFRSIFPNLIMISSHESDELRKIFEEGICNLVILDTKIEKVSAFIFVDEEDREVRFDALLHAVDITNSGSRSNCHSVAISDSIF